MTKKEPQQLSPVARENVVAAVETLHRLRLAYLAGHLYPCTNPERETTAADTLVRISTLRHLLLSRPLVLKVMAPMLHRVETHLRNDLKKELA